MVDQAVSRIAASEVTHRARSEPPSAVLSKPLHPSIGRLLLIKPESFFYEIVDRLVQGLPIAKRDLSMDKELRRLDRFDAVIVDASVTSSNRPRRWRFFSPSSPSDTSARAF